MLARCKRLDSLVEQYCRFTSAFSRTSTIRPRLTTTTCARKNAKNTGKAASRPISRRVQNIEVGQLIDVRSPEYVWCTGIIKRIIYRQEIQCKIITVHYQVKVCNQGFPSEFDDHIAENSCRLARYRFFTCRKGIFEITRSTETGMARKWRESHHLQRPETGLQFYGH